MSQHPIPFSPHSLSPNQPSISSHRFSTLCATVDNPDSAHKDQYGSSSVPIYQSATFKGFGGQYDYSRSGNPSRSFLEHHIAKISSAKHAFAVTSGMGALDIICRALQPGDEIIAGADLYGGSNRLLAHLNNHNGIKTHHLDTSSFEAIRPLLVPNSPVRLVLLESPTNPLLQIVDIQLIAREVKAVIPQALIVVDNTMMSPYLMRPLELGADVVYDSGTKYLSGHHDLMAGVLVCNSDLLAQRFRFVINSVGNGLAPFDCFLLLRGVKTLAIRMDRQQASAIRVAEYLSQLGFKVNYPGLKTHNRKPVHDRLAKGPGAVLSFETGDKDLSQKILGSTRLWGISVSFGCVNSLISMPCLMSHASIDPAVRAARNLPEDLIRLCVGIEDCDDLLEDLEAALIEAGAIRMVDESVSGYYERVMNSVPISSRTVHGTLSQAAQQTSKVNAPPDSLLVSAPGKIILFGEHAVVYGKKAIAAAVDLRCYCLVEPSDVQGNESVTLALPDSGFSATWSFDRLPWDSAPLALAKNGELNVDRELARLLCITASEKSQEDSLIHASQAFLYLFTALATSQNYRRSQVYTVRTSLPIGAGLGSSASYSVCLAASLLYSHSHIPIPTGEAISKQHAELINRWALVGEKILHGNPSGVDNTVSCFGGAISFRKRMGAGEGEGQLMERVGRFESMKLLIVDTKVSRDTKALVASVSKRRAEDPDYVQEILEEIESNTDSARELLARRDEFKCQAEWSEQLGRLIEFNHVKLSSLGVSHERLEVVRTVGRRFGLMTKLTGAGGGGCAITLIPSDFEDGKLDEIKKEIEGLGMSVYESRVGGHGVGILPVLDRPTDQASPAAAPPLLCLGGGGPKISWVKERFCKTKTTLLHDMFERCESGWIWVD